MIYDLTTITELFYIRNSPKQFFDIFVDYSRVITVNIKLVILWHCKQIAFKPKITAITLSKLRTIVKNNIFVSES